MHHIDSRLPRACRRMRFQVGRLNGELRNRGQWSWRQLEQHAGRPDGIGQVRRGKGVNFGTFTGGAYAVNTGVFALTGTNANFESYAGTAADPVLFVSAPLKSGDVLSTGIFQKDRTQSPKDLTQPVVRVAVELATSAGPDGKTAVINSRSGDVIPLAVVKAKMIPDDIGALTDFMLSPEVIAKAKMVDISIDVGRLVAR